MHYAVMHNNYIIASGTWIKVLYYWGEVKGRLRVKRQQCGSGTPENKF